MTFFSTGFLIGICTFFLFHTQPALYFFCILLGLSIGLHVVLKHQFTALLLGFSLGLFWILCCSLIRLEHQLKGRYEHKKLQVSGEVISIPEVKTLTTSFLFKINYLNHKPMSLLTKLTWFGENHKSLMPGQKWRFTVKVKKPHGFLNEGVFDYEAFLFQKGIGATGYVLAKEKTEFLGMDPWHQMVNRLRFNISRRLNDLFKTNPMLGCLEGLIIGKRDLISKDQWTVLRNTGTNHLFAIAGLHIGLLSGFVFFLTSFLWRRNASLTLKIPAFQAAAFMSLLFAWVYALLAGWPIQTERAFIMLLIGLCVWFFKRRLSLWSGYFLALFLVLLFSPLSVMSASFWLSFTAVLFIIKASGLLTHSKSYFAHFIVIQASITIGLLPLSLFFFHEVSLVGCLANFMVIPLFAFVIVPLCFVGGVFLLFQKQLAFCLLFVVIKLLDFVFFLLRYLSHFNWAVWHHACLNIAWVFLAELGLFLMLHFKSFLKKGLCAFLLFPLLFFKGDMPKNGEVFLTLLDVGQGLSAVIYTKHHVLIYDTGPKFSPDFNAGSAVILPFLAAHNLHQIDVLMVSHGDNDHIGGAFDLLKHDKIDLLLTSVPKRFKAGRAIFCQAGRHWRADGVDFKVLWPLKKNSHFDGNNASCVLKVTSKEGSILLTGDIEKPAEKQLVKLYGNQLQSTILIAPHHGSKTASSEAFVKAVLPSIVLFPVGYLNRFHFPAKSVLARYKNIDAQTFLTSRLGAISVFLKQVELQIKPYRSTHQSIWREKL